MRQRWQFRPEALVGFLEAAYRLDLDDRAWLSGVMEASRQVLGRGSWVHGAIYDASDVTAFRVIHMLVVDGPAEATALLARGVELFTPAFVTRSFRVNQASLSRKLAEPELAEVYAGLEAIGYPDGLGINGSDPSGLGVFVGLWCADLTSLPVAEMNTYRRMAHHLAMAHRGRRRLGVKSRSDVLAHPAVRPLVPPVA
ncbi:MAG TPA: hypothetical protein VH165_17230 [Kofleriaceae bacterium]|jgi:hypothetical protein|nr:hypothetical protein [Kofleriaceae bacterium]